jgi:hypothetical protein
VNPNSTRFRDVDKVPHWREQIEVRITIPTVYNKFNLIFMWKRTVIFKIETIYFSRFEISLLGLLRLQLANTIPELSNSRSTKI